MSAPFPQARFERAGSDPTLVSQLASAWALLSPAVQDALVVQIEGMPDAQVAQITSLPVSGGAIVQRQPSGQLIVVEEVAAAGVIVTGTSQGDIQAKAAAALSPGSAYFFSLLDGSGNLLDIGSGVV